MSTRSNLSWQPVPGVHSLGFLSLLAQRGCTHALVSLLATLQLSTDKTDKSQMSMKKTVGILFGTFFTVVTMVAIFMQSFVIGRTRYTPSDKPIPFWAGVGVIVALAAYFYYRALRDRKQNG